jgi:hypothetical protein
LRVAFAQNSSTLYSVINVERRRGGGEEEGKSEGERGRGERDQGDEGVKVRVEGELRKENFQNKKM